MGKTILPNFNINSKLCAVSDCGRASVSKGFCDKHYRRFRRSGDPLFVNKTRIRRRPDNFEKRFWALVDKASSERDCWNWTGYVNFGGYGRIRWGGKKVLAHRAAWRLKYGSEPSLLLLHSCDNPKCVNTDHLREGSHKDNANDRQARNRTAKGSKVARAVLHETDVMKIKQLLSQNTMTQTKIGQMFGVGRAAIVKINTGFTWKHVK